MSFLYLVLGLFLIANSTPIESEIVGSKQLRITTSSANGVILQPQPSWQNQEPVHLKGPHVTLEIPLGAKIVIKKFDKDDLIAEYNSIREWIIMKGNLELEVQLEGITLSRISVESATAVYGQFRDNTEGFDL